MRWRDIMRTKVRDTTSLRYDPSETVIVRYERDIRRCEYPDCMEQIFCCLFHSRIALDEVDTRFTRCDMREYHFCYHHTCEAYDQVCLAPKIDDTRFCHGHQCRLC